MSKIIKKHGKTALVLAIILLLLGSYFSIPTSQAASISSRKMTISDSRPSQDPVTYTFTGTFSSTSIKCIDVKLCTAATGACSGPTGTSVNNSSATSTGWNGFTYASWTYATVSANEYKWTNAGGEVGGSAYAVAATSIANPSSGATYYATVSTFTNTDCATGATDSGTVGLAIVSGISVTATVAETMTFTLGASGNAIDFGYPDGSNIRYATSGAGSGGSNTAQANGLPCLVTLSTNAGGGATVTIQDVGNGSGGAGLYKSTATTKLIAATGPSSVAGNSESYAPYGKNASSLTIAAGFQVAGSTAVTTSAQTFLTASGAVSSATADLAAMMGISGTTPAGSYADTIILIATPTY